MIKKIEKFGASFCGPCKILDRTLSRITEVEIVKYDIEEEEELAQSLNIRNVPTMLFLDENNEIVERVAGAISYDKIMEIIKQHD